MINGISSSNWQYQSIQSFNPTERFKQADVNGDSAVDMEEFLSVHENDEKSAELFSKIDSDSDGSLTESEMKTFDEEMKENMQMMMSQVMGQMAGMMTTGGGQPPMGGGQPPAGPPPAGGPGGGQNASSALQEMLAAYSADSADDSSEVTDEEDLIEEILSLIEEAKTSNSEISTDSVFETLQSLV